MSIDNFYISHDIDIVYIHGMNIGSRITQARVRLGLSKSELARQIGVTPTTAIQWELPPERRGAANPSVSNLAKLAMVLDVSFEWLATGRGHMQLAAAGGRVAEERAAYGAGRLRPLAADERALLDAFRHLPVKTRKQALAVLRALGENK